MINLIVALFLILFEAVPEGISDRGSKTLGGILEFVKLAVITIFAFGVLNGHFLNYIDLGKSDSLLYIIAGYILIRYAIFDFLYNISRGVDPYYIGESKLFDKLWKWFFSITHFPESHFFFMTKLIALFIGTTWIFK